MLHWHGLMDPMTRPMANTDRERQQRIAEDRIRMELLSMIRRLTTCRKRVRGARYLERQRAELQRRLGNSNAVDVAIARTFPMGARHWFLRMSHRRHRIQMQGVRHSDVISCFSKAKVRELRNNPAGPWRDFKVSLAIVRRKPYLVRFLPEAMRDNAQIMTVAVARRSTLIRWASERLRGDPKLAKLAVSRGDGRGCFPHLAPAVRSNKEVVLAAVAAEGSNIEVVDPVFRDDEDVMLLASVTFPALPLASHRLRQNDLFAHRVALRCIDTVLGPNLMPFLEDTEKLETIARGAAADLLLCRVRLLSGRGVLTSFSVSSINALHWRFDCLGLNTLCPRGPPPSGSSICNGVTRPMHTWAIAQSTWWDLGLRRRELNEVHLVFHPA